MTESSESGTDSKFKMGISLWLSFCVFACLWFLSRFVKGRRQLRTNLHVIEDGLRRMQEEIEKQQRKNSEGYGEDLDELAEELFNSCKPKTTEEQKEKENLAAEETEKIGKKGGEEEELLGQDKKND